MNEQEKQTPTRAIVLLSGGLDSTTVLAIAREEGYACYCLSFHYGQRQAIELEKAKVISNALGAVKHLVLQIDLDKKPTGTTLPLTA